MANLMALSIPRQPRTLLTCKKCGWQWFQRKTIPPINCPHCGTTLYNRDRKQRTTTHPYITRHLTTQKVIELRQATPCLTLAEIGNKAGVTRERVRQILKTQGLPTRHFNINKKHCANCGKEVGYNNKTGYCIKCLPIIHSVPLICNECGILFHRQQTIVIRNANDPRYKGRDFCSQKCHGKWLAREHGFIAHPENLGKGGSYKKYDYNLVVSQTKELRIKGFTYLAIAEQLNIPSSSLDNILRQTKGYMPRPEGICVHLHNRRRKGAPQHIRARWLKHLNFTDKEIINILHCSASTIHRALQQRV